MKRRILSIFLAALMVLSVFAVADGAISASVTEALAAGETETAGKTDGKWIGSWGAGMSYLPFFDHYSVLIPANSAAFRVVIKPTVSGEKLKLRLSNTYGKTDLVINSVYVHHSEIGTKVKLSQKKELTYKDSKRIRIPAGREIVTDAVDFKVTANEDIAVSMYITQNVRDISTFALSGAAKTYIKLNEDDFGWLEDVQLTDTGNFGSTPLKSGVLKNEFPVLSDYPENYVVPIISGLDVMSTEKDPYSVVVIGDSTVANDFPYYLSRAIAAEGCNSVGVVNKGIIGNSLLAEGDGKKGRIYGHSVFTRRIVDVLEQAGVRYVVIKVGANDIMHPVDSGLYEDYGIYRQQPTAKELIDDGFKPFIEACHNKNIKVIGCTITQWKDTTRNYFGTTQYKWTSKDWQIALDVNKWMRTTSYLDGVCDLAKVSANSSDSALFKSSWTGDYILPNDTAQMAWADAFPLEKIGIATVPAAVRITPEKITIAAGKTYQLEEIITPKTAAQTDVTWKSSDTKVCTVTKDGVVKAIKNGTATITCKTVNGKTAKCYVTVATKPTKVTLNKNSLNLYKTQTYTLKATVSPSTASDKTVKWVSSDESVATVSKTGKVTALKKGSAKITCCTNTGSKTDTCLVTVKNNVSVKGITLNKTSKTISKGSSYQLKAVITPDNASNKKVTWKSGNTSVAIVDSTGKVTAVGNGTANITAETQDGKYTAVCKIKVQTKVTGVSLNRTSKSLYIGKTYALSATVSPSKATNKNVRWKSSDKSVATVSSKGVVTAKKAGTAIISCVTEDGSYVANCKVKVTKFIAVKSVSLNKKSVTLEGGDKYKLKATINPENASEQGLTWKSSNSRIAKVSSSGTVTAIKKGEVTITCTTKSGSKTATCKVRVVSTPVSGVKLNKKSAKLLLGDDIKLKAIIDPVEATYQGVTWKSSNKNVATVSSSGKVKTVGTGTCTITCTTDDGDFVAKCKITVVDFIEDDDVIDIGGGSDKPGSSDEFGTTVKLDKGTLSMTKGKKESLTATASSKNATLVWSTSNSKVATVTQSGVVTAVGAGECTIYCKVKNGKWQSSCKVTVK